MKLCLYGNIQAKQRRTGDLSHFILVGGESLGGLDKFV